MVDMVKVRSTTDMTVSLFDPNIPLRKTWEKRGSIVPIEREKLIQAFYSSNLEKALKAGLLAIDDKEFLYEVGMLAEKTDSINVIELTSAFMDKCIGVMPLWELTQILGKLSKYQVEELVEYAVANNGKLKMDRIELLGKASGKNILKAIELYRASQEG